MTVVDKMKGDRKTGKVEPLVSVGFPVCVRVCYSRFTPNLRPVLAVCVPGLVSEPVPPLCSAARVESRSDTARLWYDWKNTGYYSNYEIVMYMWDSVVAE